MAREHVGDNILCVDAVQGKVTENNKTKFGYVHGFVTGRFEGVAKEDYGVNFSGKIVKVSQQTKLSGGSRIFPRGVRQLPNCDYFAIFLPKTA